MVGCSLALGTCCLHLMLTSFKKKINFKKLSEVHQRAKTACRAAATHAAVIAAAGAP